MFVADADRLFPVGKIIRRLKIDELPQLVNVLKGDMSVIGPRPLPAQYLPYYEGDERLRHTVRGGISGLAQVNGRGILSWEDKFRYDVKYVNELSFLLDVKLVFQTFAKVIKQADIGERGISTPEDFDRYRQKMEKIDV